MNTPTAQPSFSFEEEEPLSTQEQFEAFHRRNPQVYRKLVALARELKAAGADRYSIDALFHVLRYHHDIGRDRIETEFKLNNSFTSRYARKIQEKEEDLRDFFETRKLKAI